MKEEIIVIGTGGHSRMIQDFIEEGDLYRIIGFITNDIKISNFHGYPILGNDDVLRKYFKMGVKKIAIGIGGFTDNRTRKKIFELVKSIGFDVITIVHHSAVISRYAKIGEGSVIMPNVVINNDVIIGSNCVIANSAVISHETIVEDHVLISAGVTIGGYSIVKSETLIALGASVVSGVTIGNNVLIGAGAVVVKDAIEQGTYIGIPARRIK
jgi:sugar O-acyltransferase (sialic acid O-acetyltransferase NeuD family)